MPKSETEKTVSILRGLNTEQREAVTYTDGPSLILAGAGSGKTRVLTHKIAYLIDRKHVSARNILALTFTNKAAREMHDRISKLIKHQIVDMRCGTFHSFFASLLRRDADKLGFSSNFSIYDERDQQELIKTIVSDNRLDGQKFSPSAISSRIGRLKNNMVSPEKFSESANSEFDEVIAAIYPEYQRRLRQSNAMDFDDLLLKPLELFQQFPEVLAQYQCWWSHILVDEYQDTNRPQYALLKALADQSKNISVVGDDDQSIYRWRGANIRNIWDFEKDFPTCKTFRLEQNYRSTANILAAAHSVITKNSYRMEKELWTKREAGDPLTLLLCQTGSEEAYKIIQKIQNEFYNHKRNFSDFAILYRTNAQSRLLEDALRREGIAYVIVGGLRFYERKEVKDVLAYLRAVCNPSDEVSVKRIINYPLRGIGDTTLQKIHEYCIEHQLSFFQGLERITDIPNIQNRTKERVGEFRYFISKYMTLLNSLSAFELATTLVDELGILPQLKQEGTSEALSRMENVRELLNTVYEYTQRNPQGKLQDFLAEVALITDIDKWDDRSNAVTLMTLHAAKGLEFPVVFIAGLEDGLMPLSRSLDNDDDIDEERRLFYVGATRAMEKLYLSAANERMRYGETIPSKPSRFIGEIDDELMEADTSGVYIPREMYYKPQETEIPVQKRQANKKQMRPGILVRHLQFGKGVVKKVDGHGDDQKLDILFEEVGLKKVVVKYAKLEIL
ncbi:UvrD-helicase domain-containing protein [candidate division KSB1 bacterium]|nr:UvrD-helicase domain-containing protein [candidate division KSB1 bacterium]